VDELYGEEIRKCVEIGFIPFDNKFAENNS